MRHTSTHTFTIVRFANPYLICTECGARAEGYIVASGHEEDFDNWPCEHRAEITSTCPSWGPVDGCQCQKHLGHAPHGAQPGRCEDCGGPVDNNGFCLNLDIARPDPERS